MRPVFEVLSEPCQIDLFYPSFSVEGDGEDGEDGGDGGDGEDWEDWGDWGDWEDGRNGEMLQVCSNDFSRFRIVCSNDFSRCSRVMAEAMIRTISGLSACLGTGSEASKGALLG